MGAKRTIVAPGSILRKEDFNPCYAAHEKLKNRNRIYVDFLYFPHALFSSIAVSSCSIFQEGQPHCKVCIRKT